MLVCGKTISHCEKAVILWVIFCTNKLSNCGNKLTVPTHFQHVRISEHSFFWVYVLICIANTAELESTFFPLDLCSFMYNVVFFHLLFI